ncbi:prepilin peptidase [Microbacterium sp. SD291]|uniref:prepilin peptidase n=1 Tax=Microbacterium sp. SD291 TaxID=2782007 RepID=UPI001A970F13|nr:prepilin peptidase [Microbacterium sp. SD291]MBO0980875.1 prepilin peptidase [Microbacterium sp. SD291]
MVAISAVASLPLLIAIAALLGAILGYWPLHLWTRHSLKRNTSPRGIRIASTALTAASFALIAWRLGDGAGVGVLPAALVFAATATVLTLVDIIEFRLPNAVIVSMIGAIMAALVLAAALTGDWLRLLWSLAGAAAMFAVYVVLAIISPKSIGMGDVKLAAPLGLLLGWFGLSTWLVGLVGAFLCGGIIAVVMLALRRVTLRGSLPFGPSMLAGALAAVLLGA